MVVGIREIFVPLGRRLMHMRRVRQEHAAAEQVLSVLREICSGSNCICLIRPSRVNMYCGLGVKYAETCGCGSLVRLQYVGAQLSRMTRGALRSTHLNSASAWIVEALNQLKIRCHEVGWNDTHFIVWLFTPEARARKCLKYASSPPVFFPIVTPTCTTYKVLLGPRHTTPQKCLSVVLQYTGYIGLGMCR